MNHDIAISYLIFTQAVTDGRHSVRLRKGQ